MNIPKNPVERKEFFMNVIQACFASRNERASFYNDLRNWYLFGASGGATLFNKIGPHVDLVSSFLFAHETTRFSIDLGLPSIEFKEEILKSSKMAEAVNAAWHDGNCDIVFGEALRWALVYNSCFLKMSWKDSGTSGGVDMKIVEPHQLGVYREDAMGMDDQEAICMRFSITRSELESKYDGLPRVKDILEQEPDGGVETESTMSPAVQSIIMASVQSTMTGNVNWGDSVQDLYQARTPDDIITMYELWVWDTEAKDYHVVTMAESGHILLDRANIFVPKEHPFVQICPRPMYKYFWGTSEVQALTPIQEEMTRRFEQVVKLLSKQVDPPAIGYGFSADIAEIKAALFSAGGYTSIPDGVNAKIQDFKPDIPPDIFAEIRELDSRFEEMSGISGIMKGEGAPGVRSKGQTTALARMGSSRIKQRAGLVEDSLEKVATLIARLIQIKDPTVYQFAMEGKKTDFVFAQFTKDFLVKVDAHSMSPLFVEDEKELAFSLFERHCISRQRLIQMVHPAGRQQLLEELAVIEANEAKQRESEMKMHQQEMAAKQGKQ